MTELALKLMIGDKELRAIGHVAAQWAYLETQLDGVVGILVKQTLTRDLEIKVNQSFKKRMEALRTSANVVLKDHHVQLAELLAIAADASSLRGYRDDIVHGHWKLYREKGTGPLTTGIQIFNNRGPVLKVSEKAFTAEKAEDVAAKISEVNLRLTVWCMKNIPQQ